MSLTWTSPPLKESRSRKLRRWLGAEGEGQALLLPINRERRFEVCKLQRCRLRAVQDGLDDVGCQKREPDRPREVGRVDALLGRHLHDAAVDAVVEQLLPTIGARQRLDER